MNRHTQWHPDASPVLQGSRTGQFRRPWDSGSRPINERSISFLRWTRQCAGEPRAGYTNCNALQVILTSQGSGVAVTFSRSPSLMLSCPFFILSPLISCFLGLGVLLFLTIILFFVIFVIVFDNVVLVSMIIIMVSFYFIVVLIVIIDMSCY